MVSQIMRPRSALSLLGRPLVVGVSVALATAVIIGIPTDVLPNPWFGRDIPVRPSDVVVLVALSLLTGALAATYALPYTQPAGPRRLGLGSGVLGWVAVGCPTCNKAVVALLGTSGATSFFGPLQPALGSLAVVLAATALVVRVRAIRRGACDLPSASGAH